VVLRGDVGTTAAGSAVPLFLDVLAPDGEPGLVTTIALPTTVTVDANGLTQYRCVGRARLSTAELLPTRTVDGKAVLVPCYDAAPGAASTAITAARRVYAAVFANGTVDTSTSCADCHAGLASLRGAAAVSLDGGLVSASSGGGMRWHAYRSSSSTAAVASLVARSVSIADAGIGRGPELWAGSSGSPGGVLQFNRSVSGGLDLAAPGAPTTLAGLADSGNTPASAWAFAFDAGARQLYVADSARAAPTTYVDR
jgi:hypothetical protein